MLYCRVGGGGGGMGKLELAPKFVDQKKTKKEEKKLAILYRVNLSCQPASQRAIDDMDPP
jgi:hypothetical protein